MKITVYEPDSREKIGFFAAWASIFKNVIASRELIVVLFKRDFFASYKRSFLGMTWIFVAPMIAAVSWIFMNATGILNPGDVGIPYPAYVLLSSSIWGLFMGFYTAAAGTLQAGAGFITQVKYPHEVLLVKQLAQHVATFIIAFGVNLVVLLFFGIIPSWKIVFLPFLSLPFLFLGAGIGLVIAVFTVVVPEIQKAFDVLMGLVVWITPVFYSPNFNSPLLQSVIRWNPLTYLVNSTRDMIIYGNMGDSNGFWMASLFSLAVFLIAWKMFYLSEDKVIEKLA